MRGSTNSNPLDVMNQNQLQQTTSGLTVALQTAPHTGILLVRIHSITATDMMYIRVYDKNGNENRQYGSYATGGQQIMIPGYIQKGEKFRITGATGSVVMPYLIFVGGGIKALLGKARALLQEVLSHAGKYQCTERRKSNGFHHYPRYKEKQKHNTDAISSDLYIYHRREWQTVRFGCPSDVPRRCSEDVDERVQYERQHIPQPSDKSERFGCVGILGEDDRWELYQHFNSHAMTEGVVS